LGASLGDQAYGGRGREAVCACPPGPPGWCRADAGSCSHPGLADSTAGALTRKMTREPALLAPRAHERAPARAAYRRIAAAGRRASAADCPHLRLGWPAADSARMADSVKRLGWLNWMADSDSEKRLKSSVADSEKRLRWLTRRRDSDG
jgi:hypothetical protein